VAQNPLSADGQKVKHGIEGRTVLLEVLWVNLAAVYKSGEKCTCRLMVLVHFTKAVHWNEYEEFGLAQAFDAQWFSGIAAWSLAKMISAICIYFTSTSFETSTRWPDLLRADFEGT
jgi:hypothetical protein